MSEEKIIQHSHNAVNLVKNKSKSIKEKTLEFLEEIAIIIIAVSLTLAFHNWNDRRKEQEIARNFLVGIRQDLLSGLPRNGSRKMRPPGCAVTADYTSTSRSPRTCR